MNDPISDMLTRIRNAVATHKETVEFPASKMKNSILSVMKEEGFISDYKNSTENKKSFTEVSLKYNSEDESIINCEYNDCSKPIPTADKKRKQFSI